MNKHTPTPWHVANGNQIRSERDQIAKTWLMRGDEGQANAAHIVRCVNSHEALVRIAELVQQAVQNRADRDWPLMHLDLSEAAELAKQVAPLAAAGAPQ